MFERYTEPARRVIFYSRYMAHEAGSPVIETEHLLLGLLRADMVLARRFLGSPWVAEEIRRQIEQRKLVRPTATGKSDLPLSTEGKRTLLLSAEEADRVPSKKIHTEHLLLGLLCDEDSLAAALLRRRGLHLDSTREELSRHPHDDSKVETFVRESTLLPEGVLDERTRIRSIMSRMTQAVANRDFEDARSCANEERLARDNLRSLYQKHGLSGWLFE
jgi:ATP-dependent Clp protease ATP-binding subunit ClpC